jgi:hypothetical protein
MRDNGFSQGLLVYDFPCWLMVLMVVFKQWRFVKQECLKLNEGFRVEGTVIPLCHFPFICGQRMLHKIGNR